MEEFQKAKKIIEKSESINLLPSPELQQDSFCASLALFYSLKKLGKNVNFFAKNFPEKFKFLVKKGKFHLPRADFLISIKEAGAKLSHLFYEKTENFLNLYLKTNGELKEEDIAFQSLGQEAPLVTVGIENLKKVEKLLKRKSNFLINIDNQLENENYGQLNLIELSSISLSEIVFDFLISVDEKLLDREVSNSLLAGIVFATSNFQSSKLTAQIFQKASFLIEKGANLQETTSRLYGRIDESAFRIFGKILSKINVSQEQSLGWVLLERSDFQETKSSPGDLSYALEKLVSGIFPFQNLLCLWESSSSPSITRGVFYSPSKKLIGKILANFEGLQKGNGVLFQTEETDLEKVKDKVLDIMRIYE